MDNTQEILTKASGYAKGAMVGTIGGLVIAVYFKQTPLYHWAIGGLLVGGYVGHLLAQATESSKKIIFKPIF